MKIALGATLLAGLTLAGGHLVAARADDGRSAALVMDANSGAILHAAQADAPRYPASLTKIMTLYVTFELLDQRRLALTTPIRISETAEAAPPSKLGLDAGDTIPLGDAIKALVTKSANDIAVAIAEHIAGNEPAFAQLMTRTARRLGMGSTTFRNASGLPDPAQVTTARDMVTLGLRLIDDHPRWYPLFSTVTFTYAGASYRNHNTLLRSFLGTDGIKTGYTRASGFNLVSSVRRDGKHLVAAVLGGHTAGTRDAHMRVLLSRALSRAATTRTRKPATVPRSASMLVSDARPVTRPTSQIARPAPDRSPPARPAVPERPVAANAVREIARAGAAPVSTPVSDATPTAAPLQVEIARVRPVMVPLRTRPQPRVEADPPALLTGATANGTPPAASVVETTEPPPLATRPLAATVADRGRSLDVGAEPGASSPVADAAIDQPRPHGRLVFIGGTDPAGRLRPGTAGTETATLAPPRDSETGSNLPTPVILARAGVASPSEAASQKTAARVAQPQARPPSTLADQAQSLDQGSVETPPQSSAPARSRNVAALARRPSEVPTWRLNGPRALPPTSAPASGGPPARGDHHIQVGAFATVAEAERQLAAVRNRAPEAVDGHAGSAVPVQKDARTLYRARFMGYDGASAAAACLALRRQAVDCFVMRN